MDIGSVYRWLCDSFELQIAAGKKGLWREFACPYQSDDPTNLDFLRGGELVISTGSYYTGEPAQLRSFIQALILHNTCGLILNPGKYYSESDITPEIRRLCNQAEYPLFVMPWHIALYDLTRACYDLLFHNSWKQGGLTHAFRSVISGGAPSESDAQLISSAGFHTGEPFYIVCASVSGGAREDYIVSHIAASAPFPCHIYREAAHHLFICQSENEKAMEPLLLPARAELSPTQLTAGISCRSADIRGLSKCCRQAQFACRLADARQEASVYFCDTGIFRLFLEMDNDSYLSAYAARLLEPVLNYDQIHHTDFTDTLRLYLRYSGNIQQIANQTFFHRNTIVHRIQLLKQMGYDLSDPDYRHELTTAFRIREYLELCGTDDCAVTADLPPASSSPPGQSPM